MANSFRRSSTLSIAAAIQLSHSVRGAPSTLRSLSMGREPSEASLGLLSRAQEGDAIGVGLALEQPPQALVDINARGERLMTPLLLAAEGNHQSVITRLLSSKAIDLSAQDDQGRTALIIAAQKGFNKVVQMLQEAGGNALVFAQGGCTALHVAAWHGHIEVVQQLLGITCAPVELGCGDSTLHRETMPSKPSKFSSKDLSSPRESKRKLFKRSPECSLPQADRQHRQSNEQLRNATSVGGAELLSTREEQPHFQPCKLTVRKMLEAKTSAELFTPLHLAAANGHQQVVASLIQAYGQAVGITEVLESVRERGGKEGLNMVRTSIIQILNSQEDNPLNEDVKSGVLDKALTNILFPGSDLSSISWSTVDAMASFINEKDGIGRTPLHHAAWEQHAGVVEQLLELFIVNVNATDMDGFTPLHFAACKGSDKVVELLISHDSKHQSLNPNLRARHNKSTRSKVLEVKRLQQKLGTILFTVNFQEVFFSEDRDGMTALHYAVEENHEAVVTALAGLSDIDVFVMASPPAKLSVMEALAAAEGEEEKCETPLTMAFASGNSSVLLKLLKSGKRRKIMQELHMLRGYFSRSSKFEGNRKAVKDYHTDLLKTAARLIRFDSEVIGGELFPNLERELGVALNTLLHKPETNKYTLLHHAAFAGLSTELETLLSVPDVARDINTGDIDNQTALHFATMEGEIAAVKVLINDKTLKPNEEDSFQRTSLQLASEKGSRDIVGLLMGCSDVKLAIEKLYREKAVNDNAANAILVVAALIASVTFGGWLQPPLGLIQYNNLKSNKTLSTLTGNPSYAAVEIRAVRYFWVFNCLSFYLAMATVISGAAEVLPMRDTFVGQEVRMVRGGLVRSSMMLVWSIICVLMAFAAAGFACLPPVEEYTSLMLWTTIAGMFSCFSMLCIFWFRMGSMLVTRSGHHQLKWLRFQEADLMALPMGKILWVIFKFFKFIPENYTRFQSTRVEGQDDSCKRKIFFYLVKVFRLDREEYWRYHVK